MKQLPIIAFLTDKMPATATLVFSTMLASTMTFLVWALAWVLFRPFIGLVNTVLAGLGTYAILCWDGTVPAL